MKLMTELLRGPDGATITAGYSEGQYSAREHDAMAAHALMHAIQNRIRAAEDRCDNKAILAMNGVLNYANEIMHEWTGEPTDRRTPERPE